MPAFTGMTPFVKEYIMPAIKLFEEDAYRKDATAIVTQAGPEGVQLDQTIFYAMSGGQPGDTGVLRWNGGEARIVDTRKWRAVGEPEDIVHVLAEGSSLPSAGDRVEMVLDWDRRYAHMKMHTCMHLVCSLIGDVAVTGGQVGADKGRLDFNMPSGAVDRQTLTERLNRLIAEDHPVSFRWITDEEMAAQPELVRTMKVKPPSGAGRVRLVAIGDGIDLQPCGGTHLKRTSEIGPVEVVKIENKGKQNRRVILAPKVA